MKAVRWNIVPAYSKQTDQFTLKKGYGIRTESPYMPSYANTIGRHSDPYPTISDQAYSRWRIGWL